MNLNCYLGIDVGTTGCRVMAMGDDEQLITESTAPLTKIIPNSAGQHVQDPNHWWQACQQALADILPRLITWQIRSIAVDATSGTVLLCDSSGQNLTQGMMYNDASCHHEATLLKPFAPASSAVQSASSGLAKCLYLQHQIKQTQDFYCVNQADWIAAHLTGITGISDSNNCLKLGYDPNQQCWPAWLNKLPLPATAFPKVYPPGTSIAPISPSIKQHFGFKTAPLVVTGTTDSIAAFIAAGANQPGDAVTSLGTTLAIKQLTNTPIFEPNNGIYSHYLGNQWLCGGASNSGAGVLQHYFSPSQIQQLSQQINPNQLTGLNYYPLITPGERFPINHPTLAPRLQPRPADDAIFFQAILEGIASIEAAAYTRLAELGALYPKRVITLGGGAQNTAWQQIRAAKLGCPVIRAKQTQAAYGAALLAKQGFMSQNTI